MNNGFPDFNSREDRRELRKTYGLRYIAGLCDYISLDVNNHNSPWVRLPLAVFDDIDNLELYHLSGKDDLKPTTDSCGKIFRGASLDRLGKMIKAIWDDSDDLEVKNDS